MTNEEEYLAEAICALVEYKAEYDKARARNSEYFCQFDKKRYEDAASRVYALISGITKTVYVSTDERGE